MGYFPKCIEPVKTFLVFVCFALIVPVNMHVKSGKSEVIQQPSRTRVVVFEIDETLCTHLLTIYDPQSKEFERVRKNHPEFPVIRYVYKPDNGHYLDSYHFVCLPYLQILFDYLLKQGVRIVFFSIGEKKRNVPVITDLLTSLWGNEKYEALKSEGQFDIFSEEHLHDWHYKDPEICGANHHCKDLKLVIRDGECLNDTILVDIDSGRSLFDQEPCLLVMELMRKASIDIFAINNVYYMIGLFKTYFENENYKKLPLKHFLIQIIFKDIPQSDFWDCYFEKGPLSNNLIDIGLSEVQKQIPNAVLYGSRNLNDTDDY